MTAQSPVLTESAHSGGFIVSEAAAYRSRESVLFTNGGSAATFQAGLVLARKAGTGTAAAAAGNTGTGTVGTITCTGDAGPGVYTVRFVKAVSNAGDFVVTDPGGKVIGAGSVGVVFTGGGLSFTISDATDFIVGDTFAITVTDSGEFETYSTSSSKAAALLISEIYLSASAAAKVAILARDAEYNDDEIVWPSTITTDALKAKARAELAARGLIAR